MQSLVKCLLKKIMFTVLFVCLGTSGEVGVQWLFYCPVIHPPDIVSPSVATRRLLLLSEACAKSADHVFLFCLSSHFQFYFSFIVFFFFFRPVCLIAASSTK